MRFTVKICGITSVEDAQVVVRAGSDAIGLNFYPESPRFVTPATARAIVEAVPSTMIKVGLFVNADPVLACRAMDELGLDVLQLHGDEPPEYLARLGSRPVMKAFRCGPDGLGPIMQYLDVCRRLGCLPQFTLLDAWVAGMHGGTGRVADWSVARQYLADTALPPLVLAGGLTPLNVAEALRATGAWAVDTASGVESSPGRKDAAAVEAFVLAARQAIRSDL